MIHALRVAWIAAEVQFREVAVNNFLLFAALIQPFFIGVTTMLILRHRAGFDPVYVVVGAALAGLWSTLLFSGSGAITHERWMGTLELLIASPASMFVIFGGKMVGTLAFSMSSLVLSYGIGAWLFGYPITVADPAGFAMSLAFAVLALWATGMVFAPLSILWRSVGRFLGALEYPIYALSGFSFRSCSCRGGRSRSATPCHPIGPRSGFMHPPMAISIPAASRSCGSFSRSRASSYSRSPRRCFA